MISPSAVSAVRRTLLFGKGNNKMTMGFRDRFRNLAGMAAVSAVALGAAAFGLAGTADAATTGFSTGTSTVQSLGTVDLKALSLASPADSGTNRAQAAPSATDPGMQAIPRLRRAPVAGLGTAARQNALAASGQAPQMLGVAPADGAQVTGFNGLDHADQRNADNGNQFSVEPPDQALAVGNGFVLESINNGFSVYDTRGKQLVAPVANNKFFGLASAFVRPTGPFGPSLSDPRAYFDASLRRFFIVEWGQPTDPATGKALNTSFQLVAVSQTGDPTGAYSIFSIDTTNEAVTGCPCIPDFQQIGFDENGMFISQNLFAITSRNFISVSLLALSKRALAEGQLPTVSQTLLPNDFTVHPTVTPPDADFAEFEDGTEYLVESIADLTNSGTANTIRVFAVSGTDSLRHGTPNLTIASIDVPSQTYGQPVPATQPTTGARPLGTSLGEPTPMLDGGDARISAAPVFVDGRLWAATATALPSNANQDGIAFFDIHVHGGAAHLAGTIETQGIIGAAGGNHLIYPAIAMPAEGRGAIGVTITGPNLFPSTAVIPLSRHGAGTTITVTGAGQLPDDGFTAYVAFGGNGVGRWGDYGAAAVDERGNLWLGNEYIPNLPRTVNANWGTFITAIGREDDD
jgi:hypothetical protein